MAYATPDLTLIGRASGLVLGSIATTKKQPVLDRPPLPGELCLLPDIYSFPCHGVGEW